MPNADVVVCVLSKLIWACFKSHDQLVNLSGLLVHICCKIKLIDMKEASMVPSVISLTCDKM